MMKNVHPLEHYKEYVMPFIISKKEEFELLGYDKIDQNQIWNHLKMKKWKKNCEDLPLHQVVSDILHVSISDFMNFIQIESYKSPNLFSEDGRDALKGLF